MHIAILTPIGVEYDAVRQHLKDIKEERHQQGLYEIGSFDTQIGNLSIVVQQTGARNSNIALATERIIDLYKPKIVLLVGVAGGVKDVAIGDIVVAKKAYGYESGKETKEGFKSRPEVYTFTSTLQDVALSVGRKDTWYQRTGQNSHTHKSFIGAIASGDKVIASTKTALYNFLKTHYNDTLAVDMEASGFGEVFERHPQLKFLCIRGISDLLENKSKSDGLGSQNVAADNAAAFTFELIANLNKDDFGDTAGSSPHPTPTSNKQIINNNATVGTQINIQNYQGNINL
jgi:nucleoside phosphorylase